MLYLLAFLLPPLAVFMAGKPIQAVIAIPLTILGWIPGIIWALLVVHNHYSDKRTGRIVKEIRKGNESRG